MAVNIFYAYDDSVWIGLIRISVLYGNHRSLRQCFPAKQNLKLMWKIYKYKFGSFIQLANLINWLSFIFHLFEKCQGSALKLFYDIDSKK